MAKAGGTPAPKAQAQAPKAPGKPQQPRRDKGAAPDTAPKTQAKGTGDVPARLKEHFARTVVPALMKERGYTNVWQVPRLNKIVINMGVGEATQNIKVLDLAAEELGRIAGQKPAVKRAKKSIAAFKLRQGMPIAAMVTLRGDRMYEFFDRLVNIVLPRVRDFKGVSTKSFDGRGNYTIGLHDQLIFQIGRAHV